MEYIVTGRGFVMETWSGRIMSHQAIETALKMGIALSSTLVEFAEEHAPELQCFETCQDEWRAWEQERGEIFSGRPAHLMFDAFSGQLAG